MPTEREVTLDEFQGHLAQLKMSRGVDEVMVHHTWSPTAAQYQGIGTVMGVRRYHMEVRGWSDNGYHVMIGPDAKVFLCRPIERAGAHVSGRNAHTIGVSFIANFDQEEPAQHGGMQVGQQVVSALLDRFKLEPEAIRFHREFAAKTCPGLRLSLAGFRQEVSAMGTREAQVPLKVVVLPENRVVDCDARLENGVTRVTLRPLAQALGVNVHDHTSDQRKVYVQR